MVLLIEALESPQPPSLASENHIAAPQDLEGSKIPESILLQNDVCRLVFPDGSEVPIACQLDKSTDLPTLSVTLTNHLPPNTLGFFVLGSGPDAYVMVAGDFSTPAVNLASVCPQDMDPGSAHALRSFGDLNLFQTNGVANSPENASTCYDAVLSLDHPLKITQPNHTYTMVNLRLASDGTQAIFSLAGYDADNHPLLLVGDQILTVDEFLSAMHAQLKASLGFFADSQSQLSAIFGNLDATTLDLPWFKPLTKATSSSMLYAAPPPTPPTPLPLPQESILLKEPSPPLPSPTNLRALIDLSDKRVNAFYISESHPRFQALLHMLTEQHLPQENILKSFVKALRNTQKDNALTNFLQRLTNRESMPLNQTTTITEANLQLPQIIFIYQSNRLITIVGYDTNNYPTIISLPISLSDSHLQIFATDSQYSVNDPASEAVRKLLQQGPTATPPDYYGGPDGRNWGVDVCAIPGATINELDHPVDALRAYAKNESVQTMTTYTLTSDTLGERSLIPSSLTNPLCGSPEGVFFLDPKTGTTYLLVYDSATQTESFIPLAHTIANLR